MVDDEFTKNRFELEQVLVILFRSLQELLILSKRERVSLLNEPDQILQIVEDKEVLLDKISVLEDKCRQIVQELSLTLNLRHEDTSIQSLLPFFKSEEASRIKNLSDGIHSLASQARDLNHASQAIAITKLDWLKATQSFLIGMFQPEAGYRSPRDGMKHQEPVAGLGVEIRA
ncbi:MAG TPA: flagellar export chaperone FlgN [Anaerolineales bacterium]|nr:flagellar export chaperone FlgN [Acidobacteriota bacterium]HNK63003.1 flagellar export chaperone FlgN [Anaerolineales bacterium]HNN12569.1 flagellar export chaperone FlgN [Anaerolineales bacterium]HNO30502.1 flagellar export chaperone FlgN [Anaerolineales bacterium]